MYRYFPLFSTDKTVKNFKLALNRSQLFWNDHKKRQGYIDKRLFYLFSLKYIANTFKYFIEFSFYGTSYILILQFCFFEIKRKFGNLDISYFEFKIILVIVLN